jgi:hypothetical protein
MHPDVGIYNDVHPVVQLIRAQDPAVRLSVTERGGAPRPIKTNCSAQEGHVSC